MERPLQEDVCRKPLQLSHRGELIVFDCKQASATNEGEESELSLSCFSFQREVSKFVQSAVISGRISGRASVVKCKCVTSAQTRVITPAVFLVKQGESFQYTLLTLNSSNRLEPCVEFKMPYEIKENVSIFHGPTVMWSHAGDVFYTSPRAGEVRKIPIPLSHCVFGELPFLKDKIFILGQQNISFNKLSGKPLGYFVASGNVFDGSMILPHPYICITQCILVVSCDEEENTLKSAVVAATSNKQLVYFENGTVKSTCQLPFDQPENIQVLDTGRNGCLFVVTFHQGHVCAIWRETFQVNVIS